MILRDNIHILAPRDELDFYHERAGRLLVEMTALEAYSLITAAQPKAMQLAFRVRDAVCAPFGVQRIGGFSKQKSSHVSVGDNLDFFQVEYATRDTLVLTARDRHLDVMLCLSVWNETLTVTASVVTHNAFGRAYMWPVAPAHRLIVANSLRRLARHQADRQTNADPA